ncbi:hypothetical protein HWV07_01255 [Natronomonas salina]|uniref:hypothetical protein n=1 Tax=Natronomonas salina TaxID=1710540 RepID=UPI0015B40FF7|nr:hypothetical protein [Natronomonas salina]QLD87733.1 hypothetical protein HWV07_01255 [Natronomonas salina]
MNREDLAGLVAALGIFLLAFGVAGSVSLETPMLGEVLGFSTRLSLRLSGTGAAILISVAVAGSLLKDDDPR